MSSLLKTIFPCFPIGAADGAIRLPDEKTGYGFNSEKAALQAPNLSNDEAASRIIAAMMDADQNDIFLATDIKTIVHQAGGWSEYLAAKVLGMLEGVLKAGKGLPPAMREAYEKACEAAKVFEGFVAEHPLATEVFCTVVAIGVLICLAPYFVEILGFGELGPVEGSWAAIWMARYGGYVPKGSLYSFFQRLGMVWKRL